MADYETYDDIHGTNRAYGGPSLGAELADGYRLKVYRIEEVPVMVSTIRPDADTLAKLLQPVDIPPYASVAEQVFGPQARQARLSLEHIHNLLKERSRLHKRHLDDIEWRHRQVQGHLSGASLHGKLDNHKREDVLHGTLIKLDAERRKEELAFWKDSADLRENLFETAKEYGATRHRTTLLGGAEGDTQDA